MPGKSNRDRGRRKERGHPSTPREVSVERVDPHTLILRTPTPLDDDGVVFLGDVAAAYLGGARFHLDTHPPTEPAQQDDHVDGNRDGTFCTECEEREAAFYGKCLACLHSRYSSTTPKDLRPTASGVWLTPDEVVAMEADE